MTHLFRIFVLSALLVSGLSLAACNNTVKGLGEDLERNGKSIKKSAEY